MRADAAAAEGIAANTGRANSERKNMQAVENAVRPVLPPAETPAPDSTKVVTVEKVRTDTTYITKWQHDSIYQRDSIHVTEKGDTVLIDRWHTKYVALERTDTMFHIIRDTVPKPYPVEVEVPAALTWWQQARIHLANIVLWLILIIALWWVVKSRLKVKG